MDNLSPNIKKCLKTTYMLFGLSEFDLYRTWWYNKSVLYGLYGQAPENFAQLEAEDTLSDMRIMSKLIRLITH